MSLHIPSVLCVGAAILVSGQSHPAAAGFIENRDMWVDEIRYRADVPGLSIFCVDDGIVLLLEARVKVSAEEGEDLPPDRIMHRHALRILFAGGEPTRPMSMGEVGVAGERCAVWSFFRGADPSRWRTDVPTCAEVVYPGAWTGIDLYLSVRGLGVDYRISPAPGIDPEGARFGCEGGNVIASSEDGSFRVPTQAGTLVVEKTGPLSGRITREEDGDRPMFSGRDDPGALRWSTLIGGSLEDYGYAIAVKPSGNIVIAGATRSPDFPATIGSLADTLAGGYDAFAAEIDPTGSALLWCTFIGGSGADLAHALIPDGTGNLVLAGKTESPDFPVTAGAYDATLGGAADAFAMKLDGSGQAILWSTYLGGSDYEIAFGLLIDSLQRIVVAGYTYSPDYPVTPAGWDRSYNGGFDIFVTELDPSGQTLAWSTFLGGTNDDRVYRAAADADGSILLTGWTQSPDFPTTRGAYDETYNGSSDAYVARLSATGDALVWSTFLGGSDIERAYGIGTDADRNPVVAGYVRSSDFPTTDGAYDRTYGGNGDGFVASLDPTGSALVWGTFLGGAVEDRILGLIFDADWNPVVTGSTLSADFPTTAGAYDGTYGGGGDAFGAVLDPSGRSLLWGTYLGGGGGDIGNAIAASEARSILVCGETDSGDFPVTAGAYDESPNGIVDAFVSKVAIRLISEAPEGIRPAAHRSLVIGPNPFRASTRISLDLHDADAGVASLRVFDAAGALVRVLVECGTAKAGHDSIVWDGRNGAGKPVASGVYIIRLEAGSLRRSVPLARIR